ncbi:hypothetical protein AB0O67_18960 [Streptomyces sp. NPDC086077]
MPKDGKMSVAVAPQHSALHRETGHRLGEARTLMALARAYRKTDVPPPN